MPCLTRPRSAWFGVVSDGSTMFATALGWETKYIAEELGVSWYTARKHIENLRKKLGASSRLWRPSWSPCDSRILPSE